MKESMQKIVTNIFSPDIEARMIEHMNADHIDAMYDYCRYLGIGVDSDVPRMSAINQEGFDMIVDNEVVHYSFQQPCNSPEEVRKALVDLADKARNSTKHK